MSFIGSTIRLNVFDNGFVSPVDGELTEVGRIGGGPEFTGGPLDEIDAFVNLFENEVVIQFETAASFEPRTRSTEHLGLTLTDIGGTLPKISSVRLDADQTDVESVALDRRPDALFVNVGRGGGWQAGDRIVVEVSFADGGTDRGETLDGDEGDDVIHADGGADLVRGFAGDDVLLGERGADRVFGGAGDDYVSGGGGNDVANGGADDDEVDGRAGDDRLLGGTGDDRLDGDAGADALFGGLGEDSLFGGVGRDELRGGDARDRLGGGAGRDRLFAEGGDDSLGGDGGDDVLFGGQGDDTLTGRFGRDRVFGGEGRDFLSSSDGEVSLFGGAGADTLRLFGGEVDARGGQGADIFDIDLETDASGILTGGGGADRFDFEADRGRGDIQVGSLRIADFRGDRGDVLDFNHVDGDVGNFVLDPLTFIGDAAFSGAGAELRYVQRTGALSADVDADGAADFVVRLGRGTEVLVEHLDL
ncbi:MAG: calcium-binding protein [Pseudomonadota bacterium]